ncbi:TonB-dependent receptor [Sphingopyxis sp. JAI128]|uniref:TonB-dependent receptor n=1 Tax=Sphingopyxis sp. JAI128 TaxID=2723066 RepID=UPI001610C266|nr:TonB-dependent receptor [Sphingopyxis sp. JAI128]MBB6424677.1 outer membrane receptor protein involved in Fe transport [Sphingopyxis sp. JAI128]
MIRWLTGVAALAMPAAAMAQDDLEPIVIPILKGPSEEIVVVGSGVLTRSDGDTVQSSQLLTDVDAGLGARVENRLRDEAGIVQFRRSDGRSAHPTSQGVTLRGLGGNASSRALVTLDGVPQADPFGGWVAWSAYDAINLGGISITRGGGSGADGPGALAGTVGLYSEMTEGVTASAAYGSRDSFDASASAGTELGNGQVAIDGRYSRGDGFVPVAKGQRGAVDRAAPYEQGGLGVRLRLDAGDNSRIEASVRGFSDRRDRGTDFTESKVDGLDASLRVVHDPAGGTQWLALTYIQLRDFESGFASVAAGRNSAAPALFQRVPATGLGARFELRPAVGGANPLRVGADWRRTTGRTEEDYFFTAGVPGRHRSAGGSSDTIGAFAGWTSGDPDDGFLWTLSGRVDRWWLGTGYRTERNRDGGPVISDLRFASRQGWEGSGRAGVRWTSDAFSLRAAAYRGWRLPTLNELYRPFRVGSETTMANEMLKPERLWGGEVGMDWDNGDTKLSATLFANHLTNAIANVTLAPNLNQRQNLGAIDSKGIEVSAEQRIGPATLRATYALTDAKVDASGGAARLDGRRPAQIAKHGGSLSLRSNDDGPFGGFATLRYIGKQNEDDLGLLALGDALTLDAGLWWKFSDAVSIEARGENLFDELVPAAISSAGIVERATPRTLWVGVRTRF